MSLGVFDIGGTTVKHGIWEHQQLAQSTLFQHLSHLMNY